MLICLCHGVSCKKIKELIHSGKTTATDIQEECLAGTSCGCCLEALKCMIVRECKKINSSHEVAEQGNSQSQHHS